MRLFIDSTNNIKTIIRLDDHQLIKEYNNPREQNVLAAIDEPLHENKASVNDLTDIEVNQGPGSFTGTRVGVAIANALAFALNLKVNGKKPPIEPIYDQSPNITKSKKV